MASEFVRSVAVPHLEARRSCQENTCYRPHTHDALSVGLIEEGTSLFAAPCGAAGQLHAGDVVVIATGQVHQCNPLQGPWRYQMVHVDQDWAAALAADTKAGLLLSGVTVLRDPLVRQRYQRWSELVFSPHDAEGVERAFRSLLMALTQATPVLCRTDGADPTLLEQVLPVLQRLRDDESNPSLEELGALVGLSRFQLIRAVKGATGLPPLAWRQDQRITRARDLLRQGASVAAAAHVLGFSDQSHFHRVFRAHVAATPRVYQG